MMLRGEVLDVGQDNVVYVKIPQKYGNDSVKAVTRISVSKGDLVYVTDTSVSRVPQWVVFDQMNAVGSWGTPYPHTHPLGQVEGLVPRLGAIETKLASSTIRVTPNIYAVDPTGSIDSTEGIKQAVTDTPPGGVLHFPRGTYAGTNTSPTSEKDFVVIEKPMTITGDTNVVLKNIRFYIKGTFEDPLYLGAPANEGDQTIKTNTPHRWGAGDYIQVLSQYNTYTEDAGEYQLGSVNPTTGRTPVCQTSEIHKVSSAPTTTDVKFIDLLIHGGYRTTPAPTNPLPGVNGAQARRIRTVKNVIFRGLTFENTATNYRCILVRGASDFTINDCAFHSNDNTGFALRIFDTYNVVVKNSRFEKRLGSFTGSSWNSVIFGGGCTDVTFKGCTVNGEAQAVDVSPNVGIGSQDPGGTLTEYRTAQRVHIVDNWFINCSDAATTHPGTADTLISGNHVSGGSTGFRVRSKRTTVSDNHILTARVGVSLSSFISGTVISGNTLTHCPSTAYPGFYTGVGHQILSSEIISDNRLTVDISGNTITVSPGSTTYNYALSTSMVEPKASNITVTDEWKNRLSFITFQNNQVRGCGVVISDITNGTRLLGNTFDGTPSQTHYIIAQGTATVIHGNTFGDHAGHIRATPPPRTGYTYSTHHKIGSNSTTGTTLNYSLSNAQSLTTQNGVSP